MNKEEIDKMKNNDWRLVAETPYSTTWTFDIPDEVQKAIDDIRKCPNKKPWWLLNRWRR